MKLGVYAIALNEAKHVHRWLDATEDADFRLVADTGSTDGTPDLLEQAAREGRSPIIVVRLSLRPFRFDDARNAALLNCPEDATALLSLDLDEVPDPGFFDAVRAVWTPSTTRVWHWMDTGSLWRLNRVHARHGYRWTAPCHEVVVPYGKTQERYKMVEATIRHQPDNTKPRSQYLDLLQMAVDENPADGRMWAYLTREHSYNRNWRKVIDSARATLDERGVSHERGYVCRLAAQACFHLGNDDRLTWLVRATDEAPAELESWFDLAWFYYERQDWQRVFDCAKKVKNAVRMDHYLTDPEVHDWRMWDLLCMSAYQLGDIDTARDAAQRAAQGNPNDERIRKNAEWLAATRQ